MNREKFKEAMWMFSTADTDGRADVALDSAFDALQPGGPCSEAPSGDKNAEMACPRCMTSIRFEFPSDEGRAELIEWLKGQIATCNERVKKDNDKESAIVFMARTKAYYMRCGFQEVLDHLQKSPEPETKA